MPSPFPGMDPYLEMRWGDTCTRLIVYAATALNRSLPDDLAAEIQCERYAVPGLDDEVTDRSLHVLPLRDDRAVTAIEFVNPRNRVPGPGRDAYEQRRARSREYGVNLVEVELVRQGESVVTLRGIELPPDVAKAEYRVCVTRADAPRSVELYPLPLRQRLPKLAVPLRPGEAHAVLDLQGLVDQLWGDGRRSRRHYGRRCVPPLAGDDAAWADQLLRAAGERP